MKLRTLRRAAASVIPMFTLVLAGCGAGRGGESGEMPPPQVAVATGDVR